MTPLSDYALVREQHAACERRAEWERMGRQISRRPRRVRTRLLAVLRLRRDQEVR